MATLIAEGLFQQDSVDLYCCVMDCVMDTSLFGLYACNSFNGAILCDISNNYTLGTCTLPNIYLLAQGPQAQGQVCIIRQSMNAQGITNMFYFKN